MSGILRTGMTRWEHKASTIGTSFKATLEKFMTRNS